jgi:hypothetical protein
MKGWASLLPGKLSSKRSLFMAFPQILTFPAPLRGKQSLKKRLNNNGKKFKRAILSRAKTVKRAVSVTAKKHYFLPAAYRDLRAAEAKNEDIVLASKTWTGLLVYACSVLIYEFLIAMSRITYALSEATGYDMGIIILVFAPLVALFCILISATSFNFMSLAIMDGANRKVYRNIRTTLARSLEAASRTTGAWFLLGLVLAFRLLVVFIPLIIFIKYFNSVSNLSYEALSVAAGAGIVWFFAGLLRYGLVPYVALYEPKLILDEAFRRSRELVNLSAVVFMITSLLAMAAYTFGLYKLCVFLKSWIGMGTNLVFVIFMLAAIMLANGGMVMLYRKRKLARR